MSVKSLLEAIDKRWGSEGVLLWILRLVTEFIGRFAPNACLKRVVRKYVSVAVEGEAPKTPRWVSEFWVVLCLVLSVLAISISRPAFPLEFRAGSIGIFLFCVCWPFLRLFDLTHFVIEWAFISKASLHSVRRSLFSFLVNLFEVSLLFTSLQVSFATTLPSSKWSVAYDKLVAMITIGAPEAGATGFDGFLEQFRFWFGLLVMLCIVGSLAGSVVRRSLDANERS